MVFSLFGFGNKKDSPNESNSKDFHKNGLSQNKQQKSEARRATDAVIIVEQNNAEQSLLIVEANPYIKNVLGYSRNDLMGKDFRTICSQNVSDQIEENLEFNESERDFRDIMKRIGEFVMINKANMNIPVNIRVTRIVSKTGYEHYQVLVSDNSILEILMANRQINASSNDDKAVYDDLTGLPNKHTFLRDLDVVTYYSRNNESRLSLMFMSLNNSIDIKNKHGRNEYDKLMTSVSDIAKETLRGDDIIGVISEDTFGFILYQTPAENVDIIIERLFDKLSAKHFETSNGKVLDVTFSCLYSSVEEDAFTEGLVENCLGRITTLKNRDSFQKEFMIEQ